MILSLALGYVRSPGGPVYSRIRPYSDSANRAATMSGTSASVPMNARWPHLRNHSGNETAVSGSVRDDAHEFKMITALDLGDLRPASEESWSRCAVRSCANDISRRAPRRVESLRV